MSGRKIRITSVPEHAREHPAGTTVVLAQLAESKDLGTIAFAVPNYYGLHLIEAQRAVAEVRKLREQIAEIEPGQDNIRSIRSDLRGELYLAGVRACGEITRATAHLASDIEHQEPLDDNDAALPERLSQACAAIGVPSPVDHPGYPGLVEVIQTRNSIEHPKRGRLYAFDGRDWDQVPLAWLASDRGPAAMDRALELLDSVSLDWEARLEDRKSASEPSTITVQRGVTSQTRPLRSSGR